MKILALKILEDKLEQHIGKLKICKAFNDTECVIEYHQESINEINAAINQLLEVEYEFQLLSQLKSLNNDESNDFIKHLHRAANAIVKE